MKKRTDRRKYGRTDESTDKRKHGQTKARTDETTDRQRQVTGGRRSQIGERRTNKQMPDTDDRWKPQTTDRRRRTYRQLVVQTQNNPFLINS